MVDSVSVDATESEDEASVDPSSLRELPVVGMDDVSAPAFPRDPVSHDRYDDELVDFAEEVSTSGGAVATLLMPRPKSAASLTSDEEDGAPFRFLRLVGSPSVASTSVSNRTSEGTSGVGPGRPSTFSFLTASAKMPPRVKGVVSNQGMSSL
jgi:hypothetical protein